MTKSIIIKSVKTPNVFLIGIGITIFLLGSKFAFSQDTSTNQPSSGLSVIVSPEDIIPTPIISPTPTVILVQQNVSVQPDTGTISLQQATTSVTPVSGLATTSNSTQSQNQTINKP
jgi:hypothetical protein